MIITCEQCSTQFQLDDAKIPERGARVRCSRCKHAFFIQHPDQADAESADELARRALLGDSGPGDPDGESDWQFNEDPEPSAQPDRSRRAATAREAVDDLLGPTLDEPPAADDADATPGGPALDIGGSLDEDLTSDPLGLDEDAAEPEAVAAEPLGEPRDWNLFDDEPPPPRAPEPSPPAGAAVLGRIPLVPAGALGDELPQVGGRRPIAPEEDGLSRAGLWIGRLGHAVGWAATAALAALAFQGLLAPAAPEPRAWREGPLQGGLETRTVEGRWVENTVAGPLYVVRGVVRNSNGYATPMGAELRVAFFDANGQPVPSETAVLGMAPDEATLREKNPRDVREALEQSARRLAWAALAPGQSLPLQAVIASVPDAAAYFRLEAERAMPQPAAIAPTAELPAEATAASRLP